MKRREFLKRIGIAAIAVGPVSKVFGVTGTTVTSEVSELNITDQGVGHLMDWYFTGKTSDYRVGLIDNRLFTATCHDDTYYSHSGWQEIEGQNVALTPEVSFEINSTASIRGVFVYSETDKALFSTKIFDQPICVVNGDTLKVNFNLEG